MFHVYILASGRNGTLYTGMTDDFARRVREREDGVTARYGVKLRVWREAHGTRESALPAERRIKKWNRLWKLELTEKTNPAWLDLKADAF